VSRRVERPDVRSGDDRWAATYYATPNPVVAFDRRVTLQSFDAAAGGRVLDAGCGTSAHLGSLQGRLAQADLNREFPIRSGSVHAPCNA
jgi:hypothetical protein